jgi:hypothetical protein
MAEETKEMKPIWFFVGLLMLIMGLIILSSGIFYAINTPENPLTLYHLHPDIWWGGLMSIVGIIFLWVSNRITAKN